MIASDSGKGPDKRREATLRFPRQWRKGTGSAHAIKKPEELVQIQVTHFKRVKGEPRLTRIGSKVMTIYGLSLKEALKIVGGVAKRRRRR